MNLTPLTTRQQQVYDFIASAIKDSGYPPTIREIGSALGLKSTNGVNDHLLALEKKGYLERSDGKSRSMKLVPMGPAEVVAFEIPVLGKIAAGAPLLAFEEQNFEGFEHSLPISESLLRGRAPSEVFVLEVSGESMINKGILSGDFVLVEKRQSANKGDIVVALIDGEATLKTFRKSKNRIELIPENDTMEPILFEGERQAEVSILGVAFALYRDL